MLVAIFRCLKKKRYMNNRLETHQQDKCLSANILITVVKHNQNSLYFRFISFKLMMFQLG